MTLGWAATCPFRPIDRPDTPRRHLLRKPRARIGEDALLVTRRGRGPRAEPCVDWRSVVQALQEVWRAVFEAAMSVTMKRVAFTFAAAEGDAGGRGASQAEAARALLDAPSRITSQAKSKMAQAETALKDTSMTGRNGPRKVAPQLRRRTCPHSSWCR